MEERHFNVFQLARRWGLNPNTLERWRWQGVGPKFLKIRGRVVYRLKDIEAYEAESLRTITDKDKGVPLGSTTPQAA